MFWVFLIHHLWARNDIKQQNLQRCHIKEIAGVGKWLNFNPPTFSEWQREHQISCLTASNRISPAESPAISGIAFLVLRLKKKKFNHLEFRWCVFHCVVAVSKERNLKDRHHKERDHGSYSKQEAKTGKYRGWQGKKEEIPPMWPVLAPSKRKHQRSCQSDHRLVFPDAQRWPS